MPTKDRLFTSAFVSDNKIGGHGIEVAIHTFHRGIKRLQVNGNIGAVGHKVTVCGMLFGLPSKKWTVGRALAKDQAMNFLAGWLL